MSHNQHDCWNERHNGHAALAADFLFTTFSLGRSTVECKVVDWTTTNITVCAEAPASNLCTAECKAELDKVPDACVSLAFGCWRAVRGPPRSMPFCPAIPSICFPGSDIVLPALPCRWFLQIQKIIDAIAKEGDQNATDRWEAQLTACNISYTKPTNGATAYGSVVLPLVVMAASMALVEMLRP